MKQKMTKVTNCVCTREFTTFIKRYCFKRTGQGDLERQEAILMCTIPMIVHQECYIER